MKEKIHAVLKKVLFSQNIRKDKNSQVDRIKRFIERNYSNVKLEFIANEMCLSPKYVSRLFRQKNDASFREYKLKIKMEQAKLLLSKTHFNVSEISEQLGYQNPESFMRVFRRLNNMTPTEFRKDQTRV